MLVPILSTPVLYTPLLDTLFKTMFILAALLYVGFAYVVTRQIKIMRTTLLTSFSPLVTLLGFAHFLFAVTVLVLFIVLL